MPAWDKLTCSICGEQISKSNMSKHLRRHELHPETFTNKVLRHGLTCQFCGKECKNTNSLRNHERLCKENPNRVIREISGFNNKGRVAWNKGLTAATDPRIEKQRLSRIKSFNEGKFTLRSRPSENAFCTRYKYGTYKGYYCDSSWELAFLMYHLDKGDEVIRNTESFNYISTDNKCRRFFPDFKIGNTYFEIKGGYDTQASAKQKQFPPNLNLTWISKKEIYRYVDYARATYGDEFYTLYDRKYPCWLDKYVPVV